MANEPGNVWTPSAFGRYAKSIAKECGLRYSEGVKSTVDFLCINETAIEQK